MRARTRWLGLAAAGACAAAWAWVVEPRMEAGAFDFARAASSAPTTRDAGQVSGTAAARPTAVTPAAARAVHDVNADGRTDLLLDHAGGESFAFWEMSGGDVQRYSPVFTRPAGYTRIANADFNGDRRLDVLWVNPSTRHVLIWAGTVDGGFVQAPVGQYAPEWGVTGAADFDGDGKSDILLQAGDNLAFWVMDGAAITRYSPVSVRTSGHVLVAQGDFNGDSRADLVWEAPGSRALVMWLGDGNGFSAAAIREYALGWKLWGAGDVDGDGRSDLLLTHASDRLFAYWTMDGATPVRYSPAFRLSGAESLAWRYGPVAVGDYNGDGKLDIVLSRERDQSLMLWRGDGSGFAEVPMPRHTAGWKVGRTFGTEGAPVRPYVRGDRDGDGKSDVLALRVFARYDEQTQRFFGHETGENSHGPTYSGRMLATGDFDGDARQDVVIELSPDAQGVRRTVVRLSSRVPAYEVEIPTPAAGWQIFAAEDVDGDGRSDLLLGEGLPAARGFVSAAASENPVMGGFAYWVMHRATVTRYSVGFKTSPGLSRLAARGDFNGDGKLDLVWSNAAGSPPRQSMWFGDGAGFTATEVQAPVAGWQVVGAGDLDADGRSDLLLEQLRTDGFGWPGMAYWRMDGARVVEYSPGLRITGSDRGFGDYNGDGRVDLLTVQESSSRFIPRTLHLWAGDGHGFQQSVFGGLRAAGMFHDMGQYIFNR